MSLVSNQYRTCETYGIPDDPEIRDLLLPNDNTPIKILKLRFQPLGYCRKKGEK